VQANQILLHLIEKEVLFIYLFLFYFIIIFCFFSSIDYFLAHCTAVPITNLVQDNRIYNSHYQHDGVKGHTTGYRLFQ